MKNYYPALDENCFYHVYNRGNNGDNLFYKEENYRFFLKKYAQYLAGVADTYVYCLLPNHFHLLIKIKDRAQWRNKDLPGFRNLEGLSAGEIVSEQFRHFFTAYAKAINKQEGRQGSLFQKNFKRLLVEDGTYLTNLVFYIHANPHSHGICEDFRDYPHSSYQALLAESPTRLQRGEVLDWFGSAGGFSLAHNQLFHFKNTEHWIIED